MTADALAAHAEATIAAGSRSFAAAARLFDPRVRKGALALYAWCRHCDDVVDGQDLGRPAAGSPAHAAARLDDLERRTRAAFLGHDGGHPAFAALRYVVREHGLSADHPLQLLDGFRMDVEGRRYGSLADTLDYAYHVAGVVGVMMARVMGRREPEVLDRASDLGIAFQLANIARDVMDDARAGRVYLPDDWLREAGIGPRDLLRPEARPAVAAVVARLVAEAERFDASAAEGLGALPARSAAAVGAARAVYGAIGRDVRRLGAGAWDERVATGRVRKVLLVASGAAGGLARRYAPVTPRDPALPRRPG